MFVPRMSQSDMKKRTSDIEELSFKHEDYVRRTSVKIKMLENENAIHKGNIETLIKSHGEMENEIVGLKVKIAACLGDIGSQRQFSESLHQQLMAVTNERLDLALRIGQAKKRLDDSQKSQQP